MFPECQYHRLTLINRVSDAYLATRACSSNDLHDDCELDWLILHDEPPSVSLVVFTLSLVEVTELAP